MACFDPRPISVRQGHMPGDCASGRMLVGCGKCIGCLKQRAQDVAVRAQHEATLHEVNTFVTLTYSDEHLPPGGSLDRRAFPLFMKRLRKARGGQDVRELYAGEYGGRLGRPHYHACLFGVGFVDQTPWAIRKGRQAYRSAELERLWPFGHCELEPFTPGAALYVAQYVVKKRIGKETLACDAETGECWPVVPEFAMWSRRPALGKRWIERWHGEVAVEDSVRFENRQVKTPRYYDKVMAELDPARHAALCSERQRRANTPEAYRELSQERLEVREKVAQSTVQPRSLE